VTGITLQPAANVTELRLTVAHGVTAFANHRLFVEITPALLSAARSPQATDYRSVRGLGPASLPALTATGTSFTFTPVRFTLAAGARFALRARIVGPEGAASTAYEAVLTQAVT